MASRKITRKVIPQSRVTQENKTKEEKTLKQASEDRYSKERPKRVCLFCQSKTVPSYTDLSFLRRFLTDRAKIVAKERSGICSKHQRAVAKNIKYARHLALLPFVPKVSVN